MWYLLFGSSAAQAATLTVGSSGYSTIQDAINPSVPRHRFVHRVTNSTKGRAKWPKINSQDTHVQGPKTQCPRTLPLVHAITLVPMCILSAVFLALVVAVLLAAHERVAAQKPIDVTVVVHHCLGLALSATGTVLLARITL